jgi:hypothetical protein
MNEQTMLLELVESTESVEPDWNDALKRAGYRGRYLPRREQPVRWRRVALIAAAAVVLLYVVTAVAADNPHGVVYWLFDRSPKTFPVRQEPALSKWTLAKRSVFGLIQTDKGPVPPAGRPQVQIWSVPVIHGELAGQPVEIEVYMGPHNQPAIGLSPGGPPKPAYGTNVPQLAGGAGGFPIYGLQTDGGPLGLHWVGWTLDVPGPIEPTGGGTGPKYLYGLAAPKVRRVDLEGDHGMVVSVPAFPGPATLGVNVRVWVAAVRLDQLVHTIVPRDANGDALEHWHLPEAQ